MDKINTEEVVCATCWSRVIEVYKNREYTYICTSFPEEHSPLQVVSKKWAEKQRDSDTEDARAVNTWMRKAGLLDKEDYGSADDIINSLYGG